MKNKNIADDIMDDLLRSSAEHLKPLGFVRKGAVFRLIAHGNCAIIEFQRSDKSTDQNLIFTINLGVVYGNLLDAGPAGAQKSRIIDAHLRQRIGALLPGRPDKWWAVYTSTDQGELVAELAELLVKKGWPYLEGFITEPAVIALWESGQSPGLTAFQRGRLLAKFKEVRNFSR